MTLAPINHFQQLMRKWEGVHPYNAAQAMGIRAGADLPSIRRAWADALAKCGLGRVNVQGRRVGYELLNGEMESFPPVVVAPNESLATWLSAQLNRPFDNPAETPFRPFVQATPWGHYLGLVYQHWVADSVAVRMVLREWFCRLHDPGRARQTPLRQPGVGLWELFGPGSARWRTDEALLGLFRRHMRYRRVRKVRTAGVDDYPARVTIREGAPGLIEPLREYTRKNGVKFNDVFLAAAVEACAGFIPAQRRKDRPDLAVGSIVDLRPHAGRRLEETFGLFLGYTEVICRPGEVRSFPRLLRSVAAQNQRHRDAGVPQSTLAWMVTATTIGRLVPPHEVYKFHRKETPLLGGVSNVNMAGTWAADYPGLLSEYIRVSPTGPLCPVVFTLTTLGQRLQLSLTSRTSLLDEAAADALAGAFLARLGSLVE